jgi:hypothetical protein
MLTIFDRFHFKYLPKKLYMFVYLSYINVQCQSMRLWIFEKKNFNDVDVLILRVAVGSMKLLNYL